jgi:hypothetical protein
MTTEQQSDDTEAPAAPELPVMLKGREIYVRHPRPEQVLVWQRTLDRLTQAPVNASWTGSEVMAALDRCRKIVDSLLVNKADVNWMDDQFLDGDLEFKDLAPFITDVVEAFRKAADETGNREDRRATKKATKKAARKASR